MKKTFPNGGQYLIEKGVNSMVYIKLINREIIWKFHLFIFFVLILPSFNVNANGRQVQREVPLPAVRLEELPLIELLESPALSDQRVAEIEQLISELSQLEKTDIGLLRNPPFHKVFIPIGYFDSPTNKGIKDFCSFAPLKRLVEIGPDAIPFLLKSMEDNSPTRLSIKTEKMGSAFLEMCFREIHVGNPVNPLEQKVLRLNNSFFTGDLAPKKQIDVYQVKRGDACFVALGQIVGRAYHAVDTTSVKGGGITINSPVHNKIMRAKIREIWQSQQPKQKLLDSLVIDYSTRGVYDGRSLDTWENGNQIQLDAIIRLLYYFPDETAQMIADRLDGLDVADTSVGLEKHTEQCLKNSIRASDFIEVIGWSQEEAVQDALKRLADRAEDKDVIIALKLIGVGIP